MALILKIAIGVALAPIVGATALMILVILLAIICGPILCVWGIINELFEEIDRERAQPQELTARHAKSPPLLHFRANEEIIRRDLGRLGKSSTGDQKYYLERLLLVDSDAPTLKNLADALIKLGYETGIATDGDEALKLMRAESFDLVAIGGSLHETTTLSGIRLALRMREYDEDLRIILMVDPPIRDSLEGTKLSAEIGISDAILKPVDTSHLVQSIQAALNRRVLS